MTLDEKQRKEFGDLALPLMYWLKRNCNPHCNITIDQEQVGLSELISGDNKMSIIQRQSIKEEK